jgi:hypothetical protein
MAGTGAVTGGGAGGGSGGGAVVATLGGLARGGRGRGGGFGLVSSSHRWRSWAMARKPSEPPNSAVIPFSLRALFNVLPKVIWGHFRIKFGYTLNVPLARDSEEKSAPHWAAQWGLIYNVKCISEESR